MSGWLKSNADAANRGVGVVLRDSQYPLAAPPKTLGAADRRP